MADVPRPLILRLRADGVGVDVLNPEVLGGRGILTLPAGVDWVPLGDPPKPPEPTGLGAVAVDRTGRQWVRWIRAGATEPGSYRGPWTSDAGDHRWEVLTIVDVLSPGVD